jgi:hypothetical protein
LNTNATPDRSPFLPLVLLILSFVGWTAIQTSQLLAERQSLALAEAQQNAPLQQAQKLRAAADSLARKTQALADGGNANAQAVVADLRRRGITINSGVSSPSPP